MSTKIKEPYDPTEEIKKAVEKLAAFNQQNESDSLGSLQKTIDFMRNFLSAKFSDKSRQVQKTNRKKRENDLLKAIDILKSNYPFLETLQQGTPQQQKLAASVLAVIQRYNTIIDDAQGKPSSFAARIAAFFAEKNGSRHVKNLAKIHFPLHTSLHKDYTEKEQEKKYSHAINRTFISPSSKKISSLSQVVVPLTPLPKHSATPLSRQGIELFYMKVIALVEKHGILSNADARQAVRRALLQTILQPDSSTCLVTCTLTPFPGQTIIVKGTFEKSPRSAEYVIPVSKDFHLTFLSTQTGFPHPSQHTGWALPDLIPPYPHHLEKLPLFKPLYVRKQALARSLLDDEELIDKAKQKLRLKKQAFEKNRESCIELHDRLSRILISAAPRDALPENSEETITQFYHYLKLIHHPYDYLAETYHIINENFSVRTQEKLKQAWIEQRPIDFDPQAIMEGEIPHVIQELQQQRQFATSELETCTIDFIVGMGSLLGKAYQKIIAQSLSESMNFAPPLLNDFEQKIQALLYKQLKNFLHDFDTPLTEESVDLIRELDSDIALLLETEGSIELQIVKEVEEYYQARYLLKNY